METIVNGDIASIERVWEIEEEMTLKKWNIVE